MKAVIAIAGFLLTSFTGLLLAAPAYGAAGFPDVSLGHPYSDAIYDLTSRGIMSGYTTGEFGPDDLLTRGQFAKMLVLARGFAVTEEDLCGFKDIVHDPDDLYPYHFVAVAAREGLISGYEDGTFRSTAAILRMQAVTMVVRAAGSSLPEPAEDWRGVLDYSNPWHGENIRKAEAGGLLAGISSLSHWDTGVRATRGEVAQLLHRLLIKTGATPLLSVLAYGAKGDGVTDDAPAFQRAIDHASALGATLLVPPTNAGYRSEETLELRSNVTIQGEDTVLTMPAAAADDAFILEGEDVSNVILKGLTFRTGTVNDTISGIFIEGGRDCRLDHLRFENLRHAIKLGSGSITSGCVVTDIVVRDCIEPLYASFVQDSSFSRLDLQAIHDPSGKYGNNHVVYLERECHRLSFSDLVAAGGSGYGLHLYLEGGSSSDTVFEDVLVDATTGNFPLVVWGGWSNVVFRNLRIAMGGSVEGVCVRLQAPHDLLFDGFTASGGYALVGTYDHQSARARKVTFAHGTYYGPALLPLFRGEQQIDELDIQSSVYLDRGVPPSIR